MTHTKHPHSHSVERRDEGDPQHPYWKRAHHDWKFWIAIVLMLTAISIYIVTLDLSVQPNVQHQPPATQSVP